MHFLLLLHYCCRYDSGCTVFIVAVDKTIVINIVADTVFVYDVDIFLVNTALFVAAFYT
jgi:hypothetical protein